MRKILIIGSCGAGKSALAQEISRRLSLPLISLDQQYWRPGWVRTPRDEWRAKVAELVSGESWIIEGNYQSTFDLRFPACDTVIWLDFNRFLCFWRAIKRRILKNRADKLDACDEKIDFKLVKWILWDYPGQGQKRIQEFLRKHNDKKIIIIRSRTDLEITNILDKLYGI